MAARRKGRRACPVGSKYKVVTSSGKKAGCFKSKKSAVTFRKRAKGRRVVKLCYERAR